MHHFGSPEDAVFRAIGRELRRQQQQIELIASENIVSEAVLAVVTNYRNRSLAISEAASLAPQRARLGS